MTKTRGKKTNSSCEFHAPFSYTNKQIIQKRYSLGDSVTRQTERKNKTNDVAVIFVLGIACNISHTRETQLQRHTQQHQQHTMLMYTHSRSIRTIFLARPQSEISQCQFSYSHSILQIHSQRQAISRYRSILLFTQHSSKIVLHPAQTTQFRTKLRLDRMNQKRRKKRKRNEKV